MFFPASRVVQARQSVFRWADVHSVRQVVLMPWPPGYASWVYVLVDGKPRFSGSAAAFRALPDMGAVFFANPAALAAAPADVPAPGPA